MPESLTNNVIEAVADTKGVDPRELEYPLAEYIDPDALEQLADHENASWTLAFELPEHNVTVTSSGLILVDGREQEIWA